MYFLVNKEDIINNYSLSSFDELLNDEVWKEKISSKLVKDKFVDDTFRNIFKKLVQNRKKLYIIVMVIICKMKLQGLL